MKLNRVSSNIQNDWTARPLLLLFWASAAVRTDGEVHEIKTLKKESSGTYDIALHSTLSGTHTVSGVIPGNSAAIVAAYANDNRMLRIAVNENAGSVTDLTLDTTGASYMKAFLVDGQYQPLCGSFRKNTQ